MLFSRSSLIKGKHKGFIFVFEAALAIVLFLSIVTLIDSQKNYGSTQDLSAIRQSIDSSLSFIDENGFVLQITDANLSNAQKSAAIYDLVTGLIPKSYAVGMKLSNYEADVNKCRADQSFSSCFNQASIFPTEGPQVPENTDVIHKRLFIVKKSSSKECTLEAAFSAENKTNKFSKLFFSKANPQKQRIFFAGASDKNDMNVTFNVSTSASEVSCGNDLRVDLNMTVISPGRSPADIMLIQDKSGSMSWDGLLDLSDPRDIFVLGNTAFVADGSSGLRDINIINPLIPNILGTYNSPGTATGVHVVGNYAYLADGSSGLRVVNVTNKSSPSSVGSLSTFGNADKVFVSGNYAYVTSTTDLNILDLEVLPTSSNLIIGQPSPNSWAAQSFKATHNSIRTVKMMLSRTSSTPTGNITVSLRSTLQGTPLATATISRNSITTSPQWLEASFSGNVAVNVGQTYFITLTTSGSSSTRYYSWASSTTNVYADGNAYEETSGQANSDASLRVYHLQYGSLNIINISTPSAPSFVSSVGLISPADVFVDGSYAFVSDGSSGFKIIDVSVPLSPTIVGSVPTTNSMGNFVSGNYAYVADAASGLRIVDITNKSNPIISSTFNTPGSAYDVFVYSDGNAYIADNTSLQVVNVSNPSSPAFVTSFSAPYNYQRVQIASDTAFLTPGYNGGLTTFSIFNGPKMNQAIQSASGFIDSGGWKDMDKMGIVSFSTTTTTNQHLLEMSDQNKALLKSTLNGLVANGSTAIGDAIYAATSELVSFGRQGGYKFEVLLTDGQSNVGADPITAAQDAADHNIKVYTIGFGNDVDTDQLTQIAAITDANYYVATDVNALEDIYNLIAIDIGEYLATSSSKAYDSNVMIPVKSCNYIIDDGNGSCVIINDNNYLMYNISYIDQQNPWVDHYVINIPCDDSYACASSELVFPGAGTTFNWNDSNHAPRDPFNWDSNKTISFNYRDLGLSVISASIGEDNQVTIDINAFNKGLLLSSPTTLEFFVDDSEGALLKTESVPSLNAGQYRLFMGEEFNNEGWIYAVINNSKSVLECPGNNSVRIYCTGSPRTQYYILDVWVWRD